MARGLRDVYVTEFGYESNPPDRTVRWSVAQQARLLAWAEYLAQRNPHVKMWAQYELRDGVKPPDHGRRPGATRLRRPAVGAAVPGRAAEAGGPAFTAGLFATRRRGRVLLWGRIRAAGVARVSIEAGSARGRWRTLATAARPGGRVVRAFGPAAVFQRYARRPSGVVRYRGDVPRRDRASRGDRGPARVASTPCRSCERS